MEAPGKGKVTNKAYTMRAFRWKSENKAPGGGRDQGGVFRYFGRQIGCLVARGCNSDGLAVLAAQNEAAAPGLLISGSR